jgi:hypothetical protein
MLYFNKRTFFTGSFCRVAFTAKKKNPPKVNARNKNEQNKKYVERIKWAFEAGYATLFIYFAYMPSFNAYIPRFNAKKTNVNRNVPCAPILQRQYIPSATILSVGDCRSAYSSDHQSFSLSLSLSPIHHTPTRENGAKSIWYALCNLSRTCRPIFPPFQLHALQTPFYCSYLW